MSRHGIVGTIWRNIKHTLTVARSKELCVGVDENGTKFYERPADAEKSVKLQRRLEAADGDNWNAPDVSPEWNSWLRYQRDNPPTREEIDGNRLRSLQIQQRARDLELARKGLQQTERINLNAISSSESAWKSAEQTSPSKPKISNKEPGKESS